MTVAGADPRRFWTPRAIAVAIAVVALFIAANAHLIAVSFASQSDCVPHLKSPGEGAGYHAAGSSC
jgi:hypothetical protein